MSVPTTSDDGSEPALETYLLPDGTAIFHVNQYETDFLYQEVFAERTYLRHGIRITPEACVVDVGANIGMFSLFIKQEAPQAVIHAFEPSPLLHRILRHNLEPYGDTVRIYAEGISAREGEATFTYYPHYSILSGFHADLHDDATTLANGMQNQRAQARAKPQPLEILKRTAEARLEDVVEVSCKLRTISGLIREAALAGIDLLKVDAEKSEIEVLEGIEEDDWAKIKQIVLEVHSDETLGAARARLESKGFRVVVEQDEQFRNSGVSNCFAVRG